MAQRRKLLAILSADAAGYSRLMGQDEQATVHTLKVCRDLMRDRIKAHEGRLPQGEGDWDRYMASVAKAGFKETSK